MTGRKRRHVIPLRLTEKELQHLNRQAEQSGMPREKYLRALIMGKIIRPRPCTHHADLLRKVSGLCNNANQLAHRANSTGVAGQESVDKMIHLSQEIWKEVKSQGFPIQLIINIVKIMARCVTHWHHGPVRCARTRKNYLWGVGYRWRSP